MQQLKWLSCVALTCILLPLFVHGNADADNCSIRQALRNSVRNKLRVSCDVNDICTAVHCHGIFLENIFSPGIITKQNDTICFGTIINHCDTPLSMDVYLQYNAKSYSLKKRLYNKLTTYGKPCNPKSAYSCHPKETCTFSNICECQSDLVMNQFSGFCDVSDAKYERPIQPAKPRGSASSRSMHHPDYLIQNTGAPLLTENVASSTVKNSALITGLSVGAAVLLATIILVAFIIWKRQKNQTSHVPLIDNEEVVI
ncbi:Hypothetical predicted protein [Octopus vulgaris]|uniref:Uncharacterized protein n=1 Tax=Octopus vulgaris TaxID=6645 RepID=A0AA36B9F4_OCTVU|nr:Hypothetical predicted protein [Octopus vulgaris]